MTNNLTTQSGDEPISDAVKLQNAEKPYTEMCNNIRALDQNSFHLLQFVPLVKTAAILSLSFLNVPIFYKGPVD